VRGLVGISLRRLSPGGPPTDAGAHRPFRPLLRAEGSLQQVIWQGDSRGPVEGQPSTAVPVRAMGSDSLAAAQGPNLETKPTGGQSNFGECVWFVTHARLLRLLGMLRQVLDQDGVFDRISWCSDGQWSGQFPWSRVAVDAAPTMLFRRAEEWRQSSGYPAARAVYVGGIHQMRSGSSVKSDPHTPSVPPCRS
jgi:hypothetical protein